MDTPKRVALIFPALALAAGAFCLFKIMQNLWMGVSTGILIDRKGVVHSFGSLSYAIGFLALALGAGLIAFGMWRCLASIRKPKPSNKP